MRDLRYAMPPHLDFEFPKETTDEELADQVRQTVEVLNSLVLKLYAREISIKLTPVMNHYEKTSHFAVEIHKHL